MLSSIQTNQLSEAGTAWYVSFLEASNRLEIPAALQFFAPDASVQANNRVPAHGHAGIAAELERYWEPFTAIDHKPINILGNDQLFSVEMLAHYKLRTGGEFTVPASGFLQRGEDGTIQSMRLFADVNPIFKPK